ncbi:MAG: hypothetical protein Q9168_005241 [Polycauliona sp. 1 TL-2023]
MTSSIANISYKLDRTRVGLHPSIFFPLTMIHNVADIACGTGVWLLELASECPKAQCKGFDINISSTPPQESLPSNVSFSEWDVRQEPPASLKGRFDVVHIRSLSLALGDDVNGEEVVKHIAMLLRPCGAGGGWLHWEEIDMTRSVVAATDSPIIPVAILRMDALMKGMSQRSLIPKLEELLSSTAVSSTAGTGFSLVKRYEVEMEKESLKSSTEMLVSVFAEAAETLPEGSEQQMEAKRLIGEAQAEAEKGVGYGAGKVIFVAQREATRRDYTPLIAYMDPNIYP